MIELTEEQAKELAANGTGPVDVVDPRTGMRFVLLRPAEYAKLVDDGYDYDDSGVFTEEERAALWWQMCERLERDEVIKYDYPED
ncbi:MAG: hypothetical protein K2X82_03435 [Gemmataceae bacterium]|nr:hypothetical protein [Gemmataceae bacterium]